MTRARLQRVASRAGRNTPRTADAAVALPVALPSRHFLADGPHLLTPNLESAGKAARKAGGKAVGKMDGDAAGKAAGKAGRAPPWESPPWWCAAAPEHLSEEHLAEHVHHDILVLLK